MTDAKQAPGAALGYSIVSNLDGNRQITVQCFVGEDEPDAIVNAKLDRVFRVIDRQKARYELVGENEELAKETGVLAQLREDLARVDLDFDKAQAELHKEIALVDAQAEESFNASYEAHVDSGRKGEYKPAGAAKSMLENIARARANVVAVVDKNTAERDQHRAGVLISIERYESAVSARNAKIAAHKELLGV